MKRMDELKTICLGVLGKNGIDESLQVDVAEEITALILAQGYVRYD